jgi:hypothetical protein
VPAWRYNIRVYVKLSPAGAYAGEAYCFSSSSPPYYSFAGGIPIPVSWFQVSNTGSLMERLEKEKAVKDEKS